MLYKYSYDLSGRTLGISGSDSTSVNYVYDDFNRVSKQIAKVQSNTLSTEYLYGNAENGQLNGVLYGIKQNGQNSLSYSYDNLTRLNIRTIDGADSYKTEYSYLDGGSANTTTTMVKTVKNGDDILEYSYDDVGNITEVKKNGTVTESYSYDSLNQLVSATYGGHTYTYTYDNGGNILSVKKDGIAVKSYAYGDTEWKDLLTSFNGQTITYDQIGNPLSYRNGFNFTWSNGRQLTGITKGNDNISYLYNADGQRVQKTVNGSVTDYYYINGILQAQKTGDEYILFLYDENGTAYGMVIKNGTTEEYYYYLFNAQGDVIGIVDSTGEQVAAYEYGAWGDITSITGSLAQTIGEKNPIRYRGYYYDTGTGFYYLQSRYYDAETGRFISADSQLNANDISGYNMFSYCANNPVNNVDPDGHSWKSFKQWCSKTYKKVKTAVKATVKSAKKVFKTVFAAALSFDVKAGVGTGFRGSIKVSGMQASAGIKSDFVTGKLTYNSIDIGQESIIGGNIGIPTIEQVTFGFEEYMFESYITQEVITNSTPIDISVDLFGFDFYFIAGASASISFNFSTFEMFVVEIWEE